MAIDAFLVFKTPGQGAVQISGETLDDNMKQKFPAPNTPFDLQDWNFSVENTLNIGSSTGGAGAGKATFQPFKIKKSVDTGTPGLFKTLCVGGHYEDVILVIRRAGGSSSVSGQEYLRFTFKLVAVKSISWANGDPAPSEDVEFEYGALKIEYTPQKKDGSPDSSNKKDSSWTRVKNTDAFSM